MCVVVISTTIGSYANSISAFFCPPKIRNRPIRHAYNRTRSYFTVRSHKVTAFVSSFSAISAFQHPGVFKSDFKFCIIYRFGQRKIRHFFFHLFHPSVVFLQDICIFATGFFKFFRCESRTYFFNKRILFYAFIRAIIIGSINQNHYQYCQNIHFHFSTVISFCFESSFHFTFIISSF